MTLLALPFSLMTFLTLPFLVLVPLLVLPPQVPPPQVLTPVQYLCCLSIAHTNTPVTSHSLPDTLSPPLATQTSLNQFFVIQKTGSTTGIVSKPGASLRNTEQSLAPSSISSQSTLDRHIVHHHTETSPDPFILMRNNLIADPRTIYLGAKSADVTAHIGWVHDGTMERCISVDDLTAFQAKLDAYRNHPDGNHPTSPESIVFSVIVRLSSNKFFMQPDGNYTGQGQYDKGLADTKLSALAEAPDGAMGSEDFQTALHALDTIVRTRRTRGYQIVKGLFDSSEGKRQIRVKHNLFTVCPSHFYLLSYPNDLVSV